MSNRNPPSDAHKQVAKAALLVLIAGRTLGGNTPPVQQIVAELPADIITAIVLSFAEINEDQLKAWIENE